jgi:hypothetical protein
MNRIAKGLITAGALAFVGVASIATHASAFNLRVPQIAIGGGSLQSYLNSLGQTTNVNTDQIDAQVWSTTLSGNSVFTLMIEFAGNAGSNAIGVYNADEVAPTLFEIFPGSAVPGWHALISFTNSGNLVVTRFDENNAVINQTTYLNVHKNSFGFYMQGPGGLFYSQDGRNVGAAAQMVSYEGNGQGSGEWLLCFEDTPSASSDNDFNDAVVILESVLPVATKPTTLGAVKALYR